MITPGNVHAYEEFKKLLAERAAPGQVVYLEHTFNTSWLTLGVVFLLAGLYFREPSLYALAACLITVVPCAWLWNRFALRAVTYERQLNMTRAFPGETITLTVRVTNAKFLPLPWLQIFDEAPAELPIRDTLARPVVSKTKLTLVSSWSLRWFERVSRHYALFCTQRGLYTLGPAFLRSGDPFALFSAQRSEDTRIRLVVFPQVWPLDALELPLKDPFGPSRSHEQLFPDPARTRGAREHRPGDSLRHVHWKASARTGRLQTREFEPTADRQVMLMLNVITMPHHWQGHLPEVFERAISITASLATYGMDNGWRVGLMTNGTSFHTDQAIRLLPSRAPDQLARMLTVLAAVTSFPTAAPEVVLRAESPHLPWGATIVMVSAIHNEPLLIALHDLHRAGRRVTLISVGAEAPPALPGILTYHSGPKAPAWRRKATPLNVNLSAALDAVPIPTLHPAPDGWQYSPWEPHAPAPDPVESETQP